VKIAGLPGRRHARARAVPGTFFVNRGNIFENRVMVSDFIRPYIHTITHFLTRGIHYFYSYVNHCITYAVTVATLGDKILYTSHARARVVHTVAKCVMSTVVTRNGTLLFITLFLCLYARDSLRVASCNESPNRENCGVARPATRARAGCPGNFFCKPG